MTFRRTQQFLTTQFMSIVRYLTEDFQWALIRARTVGSRAQIIYTKLKNWLFSRVVSQVDCASRGWNRQQRIRRKVDRTNRNSTRSELPRRALM